MERTCSLENAMIRLITAETTAATAMPARSRVATWTAGPILASR
jgi:hypothetical protein